MDSDPYEEPAFCTDARRILFQTMWDVQSVSDRIGTLVSPFELLADCETD
jgi:hypothetical protein